MVHHRLSPLCGSSRTNGNTENVSQYDLVFLRGYKTPKFDFKTCQMQCLGTAGSVLGALLLRVLYFGWNHV